MRNRPLPPHGLDSNINPLSPAFTAYNFITGALLPPDQSWHGMAWAIGDAPAYTRIFSHEGRGALLFYMVGARHVGASGTYSFGARLIVDGRTIYDRTDFLIGVGSQQGLVPVGQVLLDLALVREIAAAETEYLPFERNLYLDVYSQDISNVEVAGCWDVYLT